MKFIISSLLLFLVFSCQKEDSGSVISKIWYAVELGDNYDLEIVYYSDKYFDTGKLETIEVNSTTYSSNTGFWKVERFQTDRVGGYYFSMKVNSLADSIEQRKIYIFANDSSLLDSAVYLNQPDFTIEIQGEIPKILQ